MATDNVTFEGEEPDGKDLIFRTVLHGELAKVGLPVEIIFWFGFGFDICVSNVFPPPYERLIYEFAMHSHPPPFEEVMSIRRGFMLWSRYNPITEEYEEEDHNDLDPDISYSLNEYLPGYLHHSVEAHDVPRMLRENLELVLSHDTNVLANLVAKVERKYGMSVYSESACRC